MQKLFDDIEVAFSIKNDAELKRAQFLFKMIKLPIMVRFGTMLTEWALKMNLPVEKLIKKNLFDHFCGGITKQDCLSVIDKMFAYGVSSVLDYSVEGKKNEQQFDQTMQVTLDIINFAKGNKSMPYAVFKPTGVGRFELFQKKGEGKLFTMEETVEWERIVSRFDKICRAAVENDVEVLVDAEESWMQDAADDLVLDMMRKYNKQKVFIFNTLQMYRWDRLDYLKKVHEIGKEEGFYIGMKIVRGAYMEKENKRAKEKGYLTPICSSKEATDKNYDEAVSYMMNHIDTMAIFLGTHNEQSSYKLMTIIEEKGLQKNDPRIYFAQLYGMSDNISFNLARNGYNNAKYLPFGPVKEVVPYLIRRAQENTSVAGQTNRELTLINAELKRRKRVQ